MLISQVSSATQDSNDKFDSFMSGLVSRCDSGNKLIADYVAKLDADMLSITTRATAAANANVGLAKEKATLSDQVAAAQAELTQIKERVTKAYADLKVFGIEAEQKLVICKTLRDIITDELITPSKGQSFVQLRTFNDKLHELKSLLENSSDNQFSPLVSTLVSLAESKGFADQGILNQILAVISKLEKNLQDFRTRQETDGKKNIESDKDLAREKVSQIKTLSGMIEENTNSQSDNTNISNSAVRDVAAINAEKTRKTSESAYWVKICAYENEIKEREGKFRTAYNGKVKEIELKLVDMK